MKVIIWVEFNDKDVWVEDELRKDKQSFQDYCFEQIYIIRHGIKNLQIVVVGDDCTYEKCFELFKWISKTYYGTFHLRSLNDISFMKVKNNIQVLAEVYQNW